MCNVMQCCIMLCRAKRLRNTVQNSGSNRARCFAHPNAAPFKFFEIGLGCNMEYGPGASATPGSLHPRRWAWAHRQTTSVSTIWACVLVFWGGGGDRTAWVVREVPPCAVIFPAS